MLNARCKHALSILVLMSVRHFDLDVGVPSAASRDKTDVGTELRHTPVQVYDSTTCT